ncbi:MAG: IS1182 family transposase [Chloroflexi bacterium]|nr:IS1182 family transposase [Chloroflexota bacterium]
MSLHAQTIAPIPDLTAQVARAAFRKGNGYMQMRDVLGTFFTDDQFTDLYPADGQPAYAPWRLALVSVMQFAENLTDRQAADAVRSRIDWKYALSLELTDEGFDFSVLSEFRQRLIDHAAGERLLNEMLAQFSQAGLLSAGGKQRTDSTHVLASVRALNRLELVGRTLQVALDALAEVAAAWLQGWVAPAWFTRYSKLLTEFRLPQKKAERDALAVQIGWDGLTLLERVYYDPTTPAFIRELPAIETLRHIWLQQYVLIEDTLRWREREEMPPAARLLQSPFDLEARYSCKRNLEWLGYKVHFTETCNDSQPHLITHILTVNATEQDVDAVQPIHADLQTLDYLPAEHLADMGYTSAPLLVDSQVDYGVNLVGPVVEKQTWQHATGYDWTAFTIDWDKRQVTCPHGKVSAPWTMREHRRDHELTRVKFSTGDCRPCPARPLCTKHDRRTLSFHEQSLFEAVQQRKQEQHTTLFRQQYGKRAGIEGTISQGVFALGMRRSRYRGQEKTHLQFVLTASAMNLTRVLNWHNEMPRHETQPTRFGLLAA